MKRTLIFPIAYTALLLFSAFVSIANATPTAMPRSLAESCGAMAGLMKRLRGPITELQPKTTMYLIVDFNTPFLNAEYQTRPFLVYDRSMTGKIASKLTKEEGPDYQGFMLNVRPSSAPYAGQEVPNRTVREPYWSTYFNVYEIKHPHECLVVNLSYGVRTDPKLIAQIKQIITNYAAKQ